jgi:hypothetical protein
MSDQTAEQRKPPTYTNRELKSERSSVDPIALLGTSWCVHTFHHETLRGTITFFFFKALLPSNIILPG